MILMQQPIEEGHGYGLPIRLLDLQRLQFAQRANERISRVREEPDLLMARAVGRKAAACGHRHPPALLQFACLQAPASHVPPAS